MRAGVMPNAYSKLDGVQIIGAGIYSDKAERIVNHWSVLNINATVFADSHSGSGKT